MSDNGSKEPTKTPEQLAEERLKRYQAKPETFIEISQVVCVATRSEKSPLGVSVCIDGSNRIQMNNAIAELNHMADKIRMQMDMDRAKILPAKHGIINYAKGMFNR